MKTLPRTSRSTRPTIRRASGIAALALTLSVGLAACSDDDGDTANDNGGDSSSDTSPGDDMDSDNSMDPGTDDSMGGDMEETTFGAACGQIPTEGAGSLEGMTVDPVATAASNNPLLSTLVEAVGAVPGLADQLNSAEALTVFAPYNDAFAALDPAMLESVMADPEMLGAVLSHHVLPERIEPDAIAGEHETLNGDTVTVTGDAEQGVMIDNGDGSASVLCGGVQTANATVYVIDQVLLPTG